MKAASAQYGAPAIAGGEPRISAAVERTVWTISASRGDLERLAHEQDARRRLQVRVVDERSTSASMSCTVSPGSVRRSSPSTQRPG